MTDQDIQGKVTDIDGNPVIGVPVYLVNQDNVNQVLRTTTDSNGDFIFNTHPDAQTSSDRYHVISGGYNSENILVSSSSNPQVTADLIEDPFFDVSITGTNSPIKAGNNLDVDYSLNNTGGKPDTQDIRLEIDGIQEDQDSSVSLNAGTSTSGVLTWSTQSSDEGSYNVSVLSSDDSDNIGIVIESPVPESVQADSLVAWYRFQDGDGRDYTSELNIGDNTDYSGSVRSGSSYQSSSGVNDFEDGYNSGSFRFFDDNSNSGIELQSIPLSSHTKMIWFNLESSSNRHPVFGGNGGGSEKYTEIVVDDNNELQYVFDDGNTSFDVILTSNVEDNQWYHAAISYESSSGECKLYVNGNFIGSASKSSGLQVMGDTIETIGYFAASTEQIVNGLVDDARIYDRSLTKSEIKDIYDSTKPQNNINAVAYSDLLAWYRFEEGSSTDYTSQLGIGDTSDYSGQVDGANFVSNGGVTDYIEGSNSGAFDFNDGDRIQTPDAGPLNDELTLSCWVNLDGPGDKSYNVFLCHGDGSHRKELHWDADDDIRGPATSEIGRKTVSGDIALNEWIHLAATFNNNTQTMEYYENGNLLLSEGYSGTFDNGSYPIHIGDSANVGSDFIDGIIDDARVYTRELTETEINEIYLNTKP